VKGRGIVIRALQEVEEMSIGVDLQRRVWGYTEIDTVPDQIFIVARESGGQVLGAFHEDKAIGFALAFAGVHGGKVHLHSHMVAVLPEYQDRGVGRMLKLAQRDKRDFTGNRSHRMDLRSSATEKRLLQSDAAGSHRPPVSSKLLRTDVEPATWWIANGSAGGGSGGFDPRGCKIYWAAKFRKQDRIAWRIGIPAGIRQIISSNPDEAERIQTGVRREFERHIAGGRGAVGFEFDAEQGSYVLETYED